MNAEELAAIETRADAATEGPWETRTGTDATATSASVHAGWKSVLFERDGYHFGYADIADAEFIAHARVDVPALLAVLRERDNTIARVRELMQSWDNGEYDDMNQFAPHHFVSHLRAALDPQETK